MNQGEIFGMGIRPCNDPIESKRADECSDVGLMII
jgi:hypothetical protein